MTFRYVLIDTSQRMRFNQNLERWGVPYQSLFDGYAEESLLDIAPLLIDISDAGEKSQHVIEEATRIGKIKPCVSFITSSLTTKDLADHLRQFHIVNMSERGTMVLRWYDTRILPAWLEVLHEKQRAFFMQSITAGSYFDRFGSRRELTIGVTTQSAPVTMPIPLKLDAAQGSLLWAASEPDAMISRLRKTIPQYIGLIPYRVLYPFVSEQLSAAHQHGLLEHDDLSLYLLLGLKSSGHFVKHPDVIKRMALPAHAHEQSFEDWLEKMPDSIASFGQPLWATPADDKARDDES